MADDYSGIASPVAANANSYKESRAGVGTFAAADPYADIATPTPAPQARGKNPYDSVAREVKPDPHAGETAMERLQRGHSDPNNPNLWNVVYGLQGAYKRSALNGLMMQPVRTVMQNSGYGMGELKRRYPNQSQEWYEKKLHEAYNEAIRLARSDAEQQVKDNPYPGAPVTNFGAGVLGSVDPTWAIPVPGVGRLGAVKGPAGVASRVGANVAGHGAMSAAADAAAQGMDIASGVQEDFDIERNLTAAAFGGAFGGAQQGLGEFGNVPAVSDFVKGLFKQRGVDTLPPGDPRARTTAPLTGEEPVMSPEQTAQLRDLIRTGTVDDIKNFLADKQGPKPTWQDVNRLVEARDATPENAVQRYTQALDQHLDDTHMTVLRDHFDTQMAGWKNKPEVEVVRTAEDIADPAVRQSSIDSGLSAENTVGFVGPDGRVRVFAGAVKTPDQANAVLYHEALGHFGLSQKFGAGLDKTLDTLVARNVGQFGKAVDAWQKKNPGAYNGSRTRAAEEVLAEMSQNGQIKKSVMDAIVAYVRRFGRQMGMKLSYSDAEINNILAMAHDAVISGKGRDVGANGFKHMRANPESMSAWLSPDDNPFDLSKPSARRGTAADFELSPADIASFLDRFEDDFNNTAPGNLSRADVDQMMGEEAFRPEGGLPDADVRQIMSEDGNRYMFTGPKAKNYDEQSPTKFDTNEGVRRNQISDKGATLKIPEEELTSGHYYLGEVLEHPRLFEEYPELQKLSISIEPLAFANTPGKYDAVYYNADAMSQPRIAVDPYSKDKKSSILHEVQHAIQDIEQYPSFKALADEGGSSKYGDDKDAYLGLAPEKEALITQARAFMDEGQLIDRKPPRFMTPEQLREHAGSIHEEAFNKLERNYTPKYRSIAEAQDAAYNSALDPSAVKKARSVGQLDKKLFIYDNAANEANGKLLALAEKAEAGTLSNDDLASLIQTTNDFHYVLARLNDDLGEVGRALNAAKQITYRRNNILAMKEALEADNSPLGPLVDPDTASKFLKQFAAMLKGGNPNGAAQMIKSVNKPYWWQYLLSWRSNMMLSGLSTHLKVSMDTATNAGREIEEKLAALPMGALRSMARGLGLKNVQPGVHPTEVALHGWGIARAVLDAQTYKDAATAFKGAGNQRFGGTGIPNPRIPVVSKVTDAIAAQDAFYRSVLTNAHLYSLGGRQAIKDGVKGWDNITTAAAGHARQPTIKMLEEAQDLAENIMLTNRSDLNDALDRAKRIKPGMNGVEQLGSFVLNYLTPFVRTQSNALMNQIVRRSPVSFLDPQTRADWAAGGARRDLAIMRTVVGTAIIVNAWNAAGESPDKKLQGPGPVGNVDKLKEMEASGWRPGSIKENGRYNQNSNLNLSLNPFDQHNNTATLVAGVREAWDAGMRKDGHLGLKLAFASVMNALQSQVFVNDIGEAWSAFSKPGETGAKKMERFAGNQAASFIPNIARQAAKVVDPIARDTSDGIPEQLQAAIPGLSKGLPARVGSYGEDVKTGASPIGVRTWFNQGPGQEQVTDPAQVELARLGDLFRQTIVSPVDRTISVPDTSQFEPSQITDAGNVRLTARQFEEYQRMAGKEIVENTRDMMQTDEWAEMTDEDKAVWVRKMVGKSKKAVREYLYGGAD